VPALDAAGGHRRHGWPALDVTGGSEMFGGEAALLRQVQESLQQAGFAVHAALTGFSEAAAALVRTTNGLIVSPGQDLLAFYVSKASYKPRFGFKARTLKVTRAIWPVAFRKSLAKAMAQFGK
jgi:hypothetical protein